uniref:hypothetical protein n=1 Tax=Bacillus sp. WP8 TaxID=756828 RepID=UPI001C931140
VAKLFLRQFVTRVFEGTFCKFDDVSFMKKGERFRGLVNWILDRGCEKRGCWVLRKWVDWDRRGLWERDFVER